MKKYRVEVEYCFTVTYEVEALHPNIAVADVTRVEHGEDLANVHLIEVSPLREYDYEWWNVNNTEEGKD